MLTSVYITPNIPCNCASSTRGKTRAKSERTPPRPQPSRGAAASSGRRPRPGPALLPAPPGTAGPRQALRSREDGELSAPSHRDCCGRASPPSTAPPLLQLPDPRPGHTAVGLPQRPERGGLAASLPSHCRSPCLPAHPPPPPYLAPVAAGRASGGSAAPCWRRGAARSR